ncbi:uncharacterized protein [Coffea arabica]|uniref:Uncharacterized protein n=1 Tax=Coffea arabica TaxID=13443 RepID=A0A6P6VRM4_COFAR|nr:ribosomal RNA-processing protein 17-like [Coffea arabica]
MEEAEAVPSQADARRGARHIKKRALKNKALSVSFNEKDLKDFVTGFHKRKKKRRREAQQKLQEAERRKRIEARKKRKLEREFVIYGGAQPDSSSEPKELDDDREDNGEEEPTTSVSGTMMYDNGDMKVTVTTREISREDEYPSQRPLPEAPQLDEGPEKKKKHVVSVSKKKQFKKAARMRSHPKPQSKRDKRNGKRINKRH